MTWLRFTDTVAERPVWEQLGTDAFMLHVAALGYSNRHPAQVAGRLTRSQVRRLLGEDLVPDPLQVAGRLVEAGVWDSADGVFVIVADLAEQLSADEVERSRRLQNERAKRSRKHRAGDHSDCTSSYCNLAGQGPSRDASRRPSRDESRDASRHPDPTRPDPSRPEGSGTGREEVSDPAPGSAAPARRRCEHGTPLATDGGGCEQCPPPLRVVEDAS